MVFYVLEALGAYYYAGNYFSTAAGVQGSLVAGRLGGYIWCSSALELLGLQCGTAFMSHNLCLEF